jgi:AcrR family transcriptional regulator
VRNGFHATSMQDVLAEANLSAGAVYRYFRGKDEIIAGEAVAEVAGALATAFGADDPPPLDEVPGAAFLAIERVDAEQGFARLALQVWGEAVRSPALAEMIRGEVRRVRDALARLVRVYQDRGLMAADAPAEQVAQVLVDLLPGFVFQHALLGDADPAAFRAGLRTLLTTAWTRRSRRRPPPEPPAHTTRLRMGTSLTRAQVTTAPGSRPARHSPRVAASGTSATSTTAPTKGRPLKPTPYPVTTTMASASTITTSSLPPDR